MKEFLQALVDKTIPPAAAEVFTDMATQFYEGCVMVKVVDHRKSEEGKEYRTIMRPGMLSMWQDLMVMSDTSNFNDIISVSVESELLKFSIRNVDLRVPAEKPVFKKRAKPGDIVDPIKLFEHRAEVPRVPRKLHEDMASHGSEYEQLMLIMDEKPTGSNQFMRLSFIENHRKKQQQARLQQQQQQQQKQQQMMQQKQQQKEQAMQGVPMAQAQSNGTRQSSPYMFDQSSAAATRGKATRGRGGASMRGRVSGKTVPGQAGANQWNDHRAVAGKTLPGASKGRPPKMKKEK